MENGKWKIEKRGSPAGKRPVQRGAAAVFQFSILNFQILSRPAFRCLWPVTFTALAGATVQTTRRSLSADTAVGVALAFGKDLPDRGMGSREGLASRRVKSRRRAFTSPSRRRHASFAARSPASRPTLRESLSPGPVQTAQASRRSWTGSAPPKWTSFKPAVTHQEREGSTGNRKPLSGASPEC